MGDVTKIQWTDHTFNPWVGCTKVAPGCANCYAEADMDKRRHFAQWGSSGTRIKTTKTYWKKAVGWDSDAHKETVRRRVFCASLADVFEAWPRAIHNAAGQVLGYCPKCHAVGDFEEDACPKCVRDNFRGLEMSDVRNELFRLISLTFNLDWLLLTKRPENVLTMWPSADVFDSESEHKAFFPNAWLGTSISDQATADKAIPELLKCRDLSTVLFLSVEPLLGPIDLQRAIPSPDGFVTQADGSPMHVRDGAAHVDWVIVGGESGPNARPCRPEWIRSIVQQCKDAGVPCFVKQMGGNVVTQNDMVEDDFNSLNTGWPDPQVEYDIHGYREEYQGADCRVHLRDKKGGDPAEWPEDLRVREFPKY